MNFIFLKIKNFSSNYLRHKSFRCIFQFTFLCRYPNETCGATSVEKSTMLNQGTMHFEKGNKYLHFFLTVLNHSWTHGVHPVGLGPGAMHTAASRFLGYEGQPSSPISSERIKFSGSAAKAKLGDDEVLPFETVKIDCVGRKPYKGYDNHFVQVPIIYHVF